LDEEADVATELQNTGLEWAAAELTSPTKFSSRWRHSSLPHQSTTPSQDDFDDSIEISTTRRRSNSTTVLDPRVRAVQFGDFPVPVESVESESEPQSFDPTGSSYEPSIRYEHNFHPSSIPVFAAGLLASAGVPNQLTRTAPAQIPIPEAQHALRMFMSPPSYPPPGYFATRPGYQMGYPLTPGFAYPPPHMHSNASHIGNHGHPAPLTYDYPPNTNGNPKIASRDRQQVERAFQRDGDHDESATSQSRSDESFETQSNNDQQTAPSSSPQGPPAYAGYRCNCCFRGAIPSPQKPLYFCPGCGPPCAIRYCSAACLLAHSYQHSQSCMSTYSMFPILLSFALFDP
jgi:hypothetical protein